MFKRLVCAAAIIVAALSSALAQPVTWTGGGVLTNVVDCPVTVPNLGLGANRAFQVRYRHANLGSNGPNAGMSLFFAADLATHFRSQGGNFGPSSRVDGFTIVSSFLTYKPRLKIKSQSPAPEAIDASTPVISLQGTITGFTGLTGNENCAVAFDVTVFRP